MRKPIRPIRPGNPLKKPVKRTSRFIDQSSGLAFGILRRLKKAQTSVAPTCKKTAINRLIDETIADIAGSDFPNDPTARVKVSKQTRYLFHLYWERKLTEVYSLSGDFMRQAQRRSLVEGDVQLACKKLLHPAKSYM